MSRMLGGAVQNSSKALIALASVTKSFVDDLVATGGCCLWYLISWPHMFVWGPLLRWRDLHARRAPRLGAGGGSRRARTQQLRVGRPRGPTVARGGPNRRGCSPAQVARLAPAPQRDPWPPAPRPYLLQP